MMITRRALLAMLAFATSTSAFTLPSVPITMFARSSQLYHSTTDANIDVLNESTSISNLQPAESRDQDVELSTKLIMDHYNDWSDNSGIDDSADDPNEAEVEAEGQEPKKLIMDIPPMPSSPPSKKAKLFTPAPAPKSAAAHNSGLLSPLVYAANSILGKEELNKLRAKIISYHSDIIKSFVDTSDSSFGKAVLKQLFYIVDVDNSGYLDREEVGRALGLLGFKWLEEKHAEKIFERADLNDDGQISLEEFIEEAPKTLRVNLVKLAKKNGGELGLLV